MHRPHGNRRVRPLPGCPKYLISAVFLYRIVVRCYRGFFLCWVFISCIVASASSAASGHQLYQLHRCISIISCIVASAASAASGHHLYQLHRAISCISCIGPSAISAQEFRNSVCIGSSAVYQLHCCTSAISFIIDVSAISVIITSCLHETRSSPSASSF